MTHVPYANPMIVEPLPFKDRRTGLKAAGVVLIVMGSLSGCFGAAIPLAMMTPAVRNAPGQDWRAMVVGMLMYVAIAAAGIATGIGSLRIRRWVRPVVLAVAWGWLVMGLVTALLWIFAGPGIGSFVESITSQGATGTTPPPRGSAPPPAVVQRSMVWVMVAFMGAFWFLFFVALPLIFILVYQGRNVRATLEYFDREPRWTDGCPIPVLAQCLFLAFGALSTLTLLMYCVIPVGGVILSGPVGAAAILAIAGAMGAAAWGLYRLRPAAWWCTLLLGVVMSASWVLTARRIDWDDYYRRLGYGPQQIELVRRFGTFGPTQTAGSAALFAGAGLVYLLFLRRYFRRDDLSATPSDGG